MRQRPVDEHRSLARWMGAVAAVTQMLSLGCMWGAFGVLVTPLETNIGIDRATSSLAVSFVGIGMSLLAPLAGSLAMRWSLRLLLTLGMIMGSAGYLLIAMTLSTPAYLIAYALLIGPGLCLTGLVLPATLVTRWFHSSKGRVLGIINMPLGVVAMPLVMTEVLQRFGITGAYVVLAAIMAFGAVAALCTIDRVPETDLPQKSGATDLPVRHGVLTTAQITGRLSFWAQAVAFSTVASATSMFSTHLIPMLQGWRISATTAAIMLSAASTAGIFGALAFGWVGDRLGGAKTLALLCVGSLAMWLLLIAVPPFPVMVAVVALIAFQGAAAFPVFSTAIVEKFGEANFSKVLGLGALISLPFNAAAAPMAGAIYVRTGSYAGAVLAYAVLFIGAAIAVIAAERWSTIEERAKPAARGSPFRSRSTK